MGEGRQECMQKSKEGIKDRKKRKDERVTQTPQDEIKGWQKRIGKTEQGQKEYMVNKKEWMGG